MKQEFVCPSCGQNFKAETIDECPGCAAYSASLLTRRSYLGAGTESSSDSPAPKKVKAERIEQQVPKENTTAESTVAQIRSTADFIEAQDRTTYAIRSLAIFIFTTLCTSLLGYGLIGAGAAAALRCNSYDCSSGFVIWGWVIIAIGFIIGLGVGINELGKSKP
jgi:hypothetical protein